MSRKFDGCTRASSHREERERFSPTKKDQSIHEDQHWHTSAIRCTDMSMGGRA